MSATCKLPFPQKNKACEKGLTEHEASDQSKYVDYKHKELAERIYSRHAKLDCSCVPSNRVQR